MTSKILPLIPEHRIYVEPFGGAASLLFAKKPSPIEVYNDIDSGLVNFWRVVRDKAKLEELRRLLILTPVSREEFNYCRDTWEYCENDVERAYRWYVVARQSFSGHFAHSWSLSVTSSQRGMSELVSKWLSSIDMLPLIHQRIMRVQIEHQDFRKVMQTYDTEETFFYVDPPYVHQTRDKTSRYKHELTDKDHEELVNLLINLKGTAILSGYVNPIYEPLEKQGWERRDYPIACHAIGRTRLTGVRGQGSATKMQMRIESIWIHPKIKAATVKAVGD